MKKYPLTPAIANIPTEGEYVLSEEKRTEQKNESIAAEDKNLPPLNQKLPMQASG